VGPVTGLVSTDAREGKALLQVLVGVGTAGLIIPGNRHHTVTAELVAWEPAQPAPRSELVERWRGRPDPRELPAILAAGPSREEVGAILALAPDPSVEGACLQILPAIPARDRVPTLRVALARMSDRRLELVAAASAHLEAPLAEASVASVLALVPPEDQPAAEPLIRGEWPALRAVLGAPPDDHARLQALTRASLIRPVAPEEGAAIVHRFDDPSLPLGSLLFTDANGRGPLLQAVCRAAPWDEDRLALLDGQPRALAGLSPAWVRALLATFAFDEGRAALVQRVIAAGDQDADVLVAGVEAMAFDSARLELLTAHREVVAGLTSEQREAVLRAFVFDDDRERARALL
jgi:hypothetical protein